jgi:ATP-dependent Clp protease ATP-binding subunit ClpC
MQLANSEAQRFNHEYIGTEHILLGLVKEGTGVAANILKNLDVDLRKIRLEVERLVRAGPDMVTMGKLPKTPLAEKVIEYAIEESRNLNHNHVGTEHLLLGLLRDYQATAGEVLRKLNLTEENVRAELQYLLLDQAVEAQEGLQLPPGVLKVDEGVYAITSKMTENPTRLARVLAALGKEMTAVTIIVTGTKKT